MITPNHFEAELLTERTIANDADAAAACEALHARGPQTVVITSLYYEGADEHVLMLASRRDASSGAIRQWRLKLPRLPRDFTGTGDLTAALLLAWMHRLPEPEQLATVLERVGASIQAVLRYTQRVGRTEVCLVQTQHELVDPKVEFAAEAVPSVPPPR